MGKGITYDFIKTLLLITWMGSVSAFTLSPPSSQTYISGIPHTTIQQQPAHHPLHHKLPLYMSEDSNEELSTTNSISEERTQSTESVAVKCPNCDKCDGSGRILGGIPTILPWWPIKPYRPCPNFIANGGEYSRIGQPLDEIAFGRASLDEEEDDDF
jgi:hypothetical protein